MRAFAKEGISTNGEAVRQHVRRLADAGEIGRDGKEFTTEPDAQTSLGGDAADKASPNGDGRAGRSREQSFGVGA